MCWESGAIQEIMTTPWNLTACVTQRASHRNQPTDLFTPNLLLASPGPNCPFVLVTVYVRDAGKEADGLTARPALVATGSLEALFGGTLTQSPAQSAFIEGIYCFSLPARSCHKNRRQEQRETS